MAQTLPPVKVVDVEDALVVWDGKEYRAGEIVEGMAGPQRDAALAANIVVEVESKNNQEKDESKDENS